MNLHSSLGLKPGAIVLAGKGAIQQMDAIKIRGSGYAVNFIRHGLVFGINYQSLR